MNKRILYSCLSLCLAAALCLCGCGDTSAAKNAAAAFEPVLSTSENADNTAIVIEGTVDLPDGAVITIQTTGDGGARSAVLDTYHTYTGLSAWCDQNELTVSTVEPQTVKVQSGKFSAEIPMNKVPAQNYTFEISLQPSDEQPEKVASMLENAADDADFTAEASAVYPNEEALGAEKADALKKAEDFINTHTEQLELLCTESANAFIKAFAADPALSKLTPTSEPICTVTADADCIVLTLDDVYWDYYLSPDPKKYEITDYRSVLAENWLIPCVKRCENEINILYGHNACGRFMSSDGRIIATMTDQYEVAFEEKVNFEEN